MVKGNGLLILLLVGVAALLFLQFRQKAAALPSGFANDETWNWVDWKGNPRSITVIRHVRAQP